jgi:signal-transduction protein with cAMP-binding, CBS, and nucleotidyltransferase domain
VIADHMSRELLRAAPDQSIAEAARDMVARGVGAVLVMDGDRLDGILTERDILKAVAMGLKEDVRVRDWMTRNPETIEASDSTGHAAALMIHGGFRHLPVLDGGEIVGIVSIRDLMRVTLDDSSPRGV